MNTPKVVIIDRDGTINLASGEDGSPFYYILKPEHIILKPGARDAAKIVEAFGVPCYLATKQRCISKGLIGIGAVREINDRTASLLGIGFRDMLVEPEAKTKVALYREIMLRHPDIPASEFILFDDSESELEAAKKLGMQTADGAKLYDEICRVFALR